MLINGMKYIQTVFAIGLAHFLQKYPQGLPLNISTKAVHTMDYAWVHLHLLRDFTVTALDQ